MKFFISYSRSVKQDVKAIIDLLKAAGHEVWWDGDIPEMADWWATILDNIEWCEVLIFMVSERAVESPYCLAELKYATDLNRPILPFVMDDETQYTIPSEVTPKRNQWFKYKGNPAEVLNRIKNSCDKLDWDEYKEMPATRPIEPNTGSGSIIKEFQLAVDLANEGYFEEAIKRFRNVSSLDSKNLGEKCRLWIEQIQTYIPIVELAEHSSTFDIAFSKWNEYLENFMLVFDPFDITEQMKKPELLEISASPSPTPTSLPPDLSTILPEPFEWCEIPEGTVTIARTKYDVKSFYMARYPLTNAQYSLFIQADGYNYEHREWWTDEGWQACLDGWIEPAYWTHSNFNDDHKPVVGVSWYEVIAYCTWLNENLKKSLLNSVYEITLPTEQQWQRAAQADDKRKYPWGNKLDETRTNIAFSRFGGATSLVTKYPDSASPYGVMDLYGNVWEWCLNEYKDRKKVELNGSNYRAIRGSSFMSTREATITKREGESPSVRSNKIGFRLCAVPKQANS